MAFIVYPTTGWNSYISIVEADTIIAENILDTEKWDNLQNTHKEIYLKQSTMLIKFKLKELTSLTVPNDIKLAVCHLSVYSIDKDMLNSDGKENIKIIDIDQAIMKEFFGRGKKSNSFPSIVNSLLNSSGLLSSDFATAGVFKVQRA